MQVGMNKYKIISREGDSFGVYFAETEEDAIDGCKADYYRILVMLRYPKRMIEDHQTLYNLKAIKVDWSMNTCPHDNAEQEGTEMYCPDCNTYFSHKELLTQCEHCENMLAMGEVCWGTKHFVRVKQ